MRKIYILFSTICFILGLGKLHAQTPPYEGTIFIDSNIIKSSDPSVIQSTTYAGQANRTVYDSRLNNWVIINAYLFNVVWSDGLTTEAIVNPEFGSIAAATTEAEKYGYVVGKLPYSLRVDVDELWIHQGIASFGGGNRSILIHTGRSAEYEADGILEETLVHEASHTSLDIAHATAAGWIAAQQGDVNFISTYARDNPVREDIAESFLTWFAVRYRRNRISQTDYDKITQAIPGRLAYFDNQNFNLAPQMSTLPVKLVHFSANYQNGNAVLNWTTAHEQNASHFAVERSDDARDWRPVGTVAARGNSSVNNDYSFTDYTVPATCFYRLKMIDRDGKSAYSPVQSISKKEAKTVSFYPNPVGDVITFKNTAGFPVLKIAVANVLGKQVMQRLGDREQLHVAHLAPGIYFLQIFLEEKTYRYTFIKQ